MLVDELHCWCSWVRPTAAPTLATMLGVAQKRRCGGVKTATEITQRPIRKWWRDHVIRCGTRHYERVWTANQSGFKSISDVLNASIEEIDRLYQKWWRTGLPTGFAELDKMTAGLQPDNWLFWLPGQPLVRRPLSEYFPNVATMNATVAIFSLEMGAESCQPDAVCRR